MLYQLAYTHSAASMIIQRTIPICVITIMIMAVSESVVSADAPSAKVRPSGSPLTPLGWQAHASRYIGSPTFRFAPVEDAVEYRVELRSSFYRADSRDAAKAAVHSTRSKTPELSLHRLWKHVLPGPVTALVTALDKDGAELARNVLLFRKCRPFNGVIPEWKCSIPELVEGVASFLVNVRSPNAVEPDRSPLLWHAIIDADGTVKPLGYPTHNVYYIEFFLDYAKWTKDRDLARKAITLARELADFNIKYRTPGDWKLPNVFYTTTVDGHMGGEADRDALIITLTGLLGRGLLRLGLDQNETKYMDAAVATARCLVDSQFPEGNWPFRIEPKTGRIDNTYTSSVILPVLLFDELLAAPKVFAGPDAVKFTEQLKAARSKAMQWIIDNPMKDYRWEGFCEDVRDLPPFVALEWYDAVWTAKYFIEHREEFPDQFEPALKLLDWIEDQFVCWYAVDVPYMESPHPMAPVVMEQYRCYKPVECCNAWLFETLLAAHKATGKDIYLQKSKSLAAALTHARRPNGSMATWCFYKNPDQPKEHGDWFACMVYDAHMLMLYESILR